MPVDASELETLRDALLRARARGVREVEYSDGRRVRYSTDAEMSDALAALERRIASANPSRPSAVVFTTSKGL